MTKQSQQTVGQKTQNIRSTCSVNECLSPANRISSGLCEKHYMRLRRKGSTEDLKQKERTIHSQGYVMIANKEHPLASGKPVGTRLYEHRVVFFDTYGGGDHSCHWCGIQINFSEMHVDHVNAKKDDNRIENLVASCPKCNMGRCVDKMTKTMQERGLMITWNGETKHVSTWASELGIHSNSLKARLKSGWSIDDAMSKPRGKFGPVRRA